MRQLGLDFITVLGMPPVEYVHLAADLGFSSIGLGLDPLPPNPHNYPAWTLRDPNLRRETKVALNDRGISLAVGEGFWVFPKADIRARASDLELMAELGAERINILSIDRDRDRSFDQLATLVEMADAIGLQSTVEFVPMLVISDLKTALDLIKHCGSPNLRLLLDAMHLTRSGASAADIAALDSNLIGYAQISDCKLGSSVEAYAQQAGADRLPPGEGDLPLADFIKALPKNYPLGLEIPMASAAQAGEGPRTRIQRCVDARRALLATIDQ